MAVHQRKQGNKNKSADAKDPKKASTNSDNLSKTSDEGCQTFKFPWRKVFTRILLTFALLLLVFWTSHKNDILVLAGQKQRLELKTVEVPCSKSYLGDVSKFKGCIPNKCGRFVSDVIISQAESAHLLRVFRKGLAFGGSSGGASILDLHSGALSNKNSFINIYEKLKADKKSMIFTSNDFKVYSNIRLKIQQSIAYSFGIQVDKLYLTHPTFFSEMTAKPAMTTHDEYWHVHVDKETYPSFHYTSLLYLSNYNEDFTGGRFIFVGDEKNMTVEPRIGRVSAFTSGAENPHYVEQVKSGTRYAITVSFTCDPKQAISDPDRKKLD